MGGSFAVWGGLFASFDCTLMYIRQREDHWNAIAAGALTGGVLSARMGANAAFRSAVMGGVILVRCPYFYVLVRTSKYRRLEAHLQDVSLKSPCWFLLS